MFGLVCQMIYNGWGEITKWILVTDGEHLSDTVAVEHCEEVLLLKTADGLPTPTTVKSALIMVKR